MIELSRVADGEKSEGKQWNKFWRSCQKNIADNFDLN